MGYSHCLPHTRSVIQSMSTSTLHVTKSIYVYAAKCSCSARDSITHIYFFTFIGRISSNAYSWFSWTWDSQHWATELFFYWMHYAISHTACKLKLLSLDVRRFFSIWICVLFCFVTMNVFCIDWMVANGNVRSAIVQHPIIIICISDLS